MRTFGGPVARIALLCAALAVAATLVLWQRTEDDCAEAGATVVREITGSVDRSVLPGALRTLTADCHESRPVLAAAGALNQAGRQAEAEPLVRHALREEPDNFAAWAILSVALADSDPGAASRARARALELNPLAGG
jgi:hypothetical protein